MRVTLHSLRKDMMLRHVDTSAYEIKRKLSCGIFFAFTRTQGIGFDGKKLWQQLRLLRVFVMTKINFLSKLTLLQCIVHSMVEIIQFQIILLKIRFKHFPARN